MTGQPTPRIDKCEGVVKWFYEKMGYGFIVGPDGRDVLVHFSAIEGEGYRFLKEGCVVRYDAVWTNRGWHATKVARVGTVEVRFPFRPGHARSPRR